MAVLVTSGLTMGVLPTILWHAHHLYDSQTDSLYARGMHSNKVRGSAQVSQLNWYSLKAECSSLEALLFSPFCRGLCPPFSDFIDDQWRWCCSATRGENQTG